MPEVCMTGLCITGVCIARESMTGGSYDKTRPELVCFDYKSLYDMSSNEKRLSDKSFIA